MKIRLFYHSLISDWNHGNAHFLRGIVTELKTRGHDVVVFEPANGWSLRNLLAEQGESALQRFRAAYPGLSSVQYDRESFDYDVALEGADLVIVHEWNPPEVVARIGQIRRRQGFVALFHDTHHRLVSDPAAMRVYDLRNYDGVLAYGRILREKYLESGLTERAWTWHEAADVRHFRPLEGRPLEGDLVWIGNWGDDERAHELEEFLIEPVRKLRLKARVYGVRYPDEAKRLLANAGIEYAGWLPNFDVPEVFARFKMTVHVPRRPYATTLPGIPTIRPFEALASGIPLVSSPWTDAERLFSSGDFVSVANGTRMTEALASLRDDSSARRKLARHGLATIEAKHTCAHRVDELLQIVREITSDDSPIPTEAPTPVPLISPLLNPA